MELAALVITRALDDENSPAKAIKEFFRENYGAVEPALADVLRPPKLRLSKASFEPQVMGNKLGSIALDREDLGLGRELNALTEALISAVAKVASAHQMPPLILHFDELDQGLSTLDPSREQMLIGLALAAHAIRHDYRDLHPPINPVIYLRTDLWEKLQFSDKNKITQALALNLEWGSPALKAMINKRLSTRIAPGTDWDAVSSSDLMRGSQAKWDHILARTFLRPRDVIQFLNSALAQAMARADEPLVFENQDIVAARDSYSAYLKNELDDEIVAHWRHWDEALQACSAISTLTFDLDRFIEEYAKRRSADNAVSPEDGLRLLYEFSVLGYERRSGYGGSSWAVRYTNPEAGWDKAASRFKVHLGLKEYAKLREERGRED